MKVVVYTKNRCAQCTQTKKLLTRKGVQYEEINVDNNEGEKTELMNEGWLSLPVVKTEKESWSGFQPDKINELAE